MTINIVRAVFLISCALLTLSIGSYVEAAPSARKRYQSPDKTLIAFVRTSKASEAMEESRVEIRSASGRIMAKTDYTSRDAEHGYGVIKAIWTADSQFFVYSLESSGGHQPWHSPVFYFRRKDNKFINLDRQLKDAVMNPQFSVQHPDKVTVELYFTKKKKTVSLSSLSQK